MVTCTWEDEARRADEAVDGGSHVLMDEVLIERGHVGTQLRVALRPPRTIRRRHHPPEHRTASNVQITWASNVRPEREVDGRLYIHV